MELLVVPQALEESFIWIMTSAPDFHVFYPNSDINLTGIRITMYTDPVLTVKESSGYKLQNGNPN